MARRRKRRAIVRSRRPRRRRRNPGALAPVLANPRRRRRVGRRRSVVRGRRIRRRNPAGLRGITVQGITRTLMQGAQDALVVVGGELGGNLIANQIPALVKDAAGVETQAGVLIRRGLSAGAVGVAAGLIFRGNNMMARLAVAGALASPIKTIIRPMLPATGAFAGLLASYPRRLSAYPMPSLAAYPSAGLAGAPGRYGYHYST